MSQKEYFNKILKISLVLLLVVVSVGTWYVSYRNNLVTAYSDAQSHLDIARSVIDNRQTGIAQLGTVWLPFNHILFLLLIWNDWAWHSGFAGSFFSMLAYILSAIGIYKIVKELTDNFWASIVGGAAFALNPNILYLQTTPLTEPLYLVLFIFSTFFLIKFIKTDNLRYLLLVGIFGTLQVLTRYDGWFVVFIQGLIIIYHQRFIRKVGFQEAIGKSLLFAMPVIFGIGMWILWNALIFGDPLYFMFGFNSAHAQQVIIQNNEGLITKGNLYVSALAYWYAFSDNIGVYLIALASIGAIVFLSTKSVIGDFKNRVLIPIIFLCPILFNILALYLGFSILNVPQLHWNPSAIFSYQWFNIRYGIMGLPFVAVFTGLLVEKAKKRIIPLLFILIIAVQSLIIYKSGIITIIEGTIGRGSGAGYDTAATLLAEDVQPGQNILISATLYGSVIFKSGFPIKDFITEGDSVQWNEALADPQDHADWIVMGNQNENDPIYLDLLKNNPQQFFKEYVNVYCDSSICIYKKRNAAEMFVYADGTNLKVGDANFIVNGVNYYDIAYQSTSTIDTTFKNLSSIGVNTVRFWMFGDGNSNGFQPTAGIPNEGRFENADYVIADARNYNIRLIPVLVNNWTDYGGEQQYLKWTGKDPSDQDLFYTDPETIALFENYINHVIPRKNTITGISYSDDPTIMAWEIVNEPRFSSEDSQAFVQWVSNVSSYIRQEDPNHMITLETDTTSVGSNGALNISDYCSRLPVDLCTAHLYLYNNNQPIYPNFNDVKDNVQQYVQIANSDNKPFILGEVGVSKTTSPFGYQPLVALKDMLSYNHSSGALVWNWSNVSDTAYAFTPGGTNGTYTLNDLSNVLGGPTPSKIYFPEENTNEGGYDLSTPETEPIQAISLPPVATSTVAIATSTTVTIVPTAPISSISSSSPEVTSAPSEPSQTIVVSKSLPYSTTVFNANDWIDGWASSSFTNGELTLGSNALNSSAGIFLSGSNTWTNYLLTADIELVKGQIFELVGRRTDDSDLIQCVFSDVDTSVEHISIDRIVNNQYNLIGDGQVFINTAAHIPLSDINVSMKVQGSNVQCSIDGATILDNVNNGLPPILLEGGVGFESWDSQPSNSEIIVKQMSVTPLN